jgi:hypothetical protein
MWGMTDNYFRSSCFSEKRGGVLSFNACPRPDRLGFVMKY